MVTGGGTVDELHFTTTGGNDSGGGGGGGQVNGCIYYDSMSLRSSSYDSTTGNITVQMRIYVYNSGSTSTSATIYYGVNGNGYFNQSITLSGYDDDYITCNLTIYVGKNYSGTSYTFSFNGYVDSSGSNCSNDYFDEDVTATWTGTVTPTRPAKFYWISSSTNLSKGSAVSTYITATKWKQLQTNINEVRAYKGYSNYTFTTVSSGSTIKASYYNELANAINAMLSSSSSYRVATVSTGDPITAAVMNKLQTSINSIT
jgi:hypothetical protein